MRAELSKLFTTDPGGGPPIRSDVALGARAALVFAARRDLPDVLGFEDLAAGATAAHMEALRRLSADAAFIDAETFPLPKSDGRGSRPMTVMSPFDELVLRTYVARCSAAIHTATDPTRCLNGLIDRAGRSDWYPTGISAKFAQRRQLREDYYNRPDIDAVGFFDAKEFFSNCGHSTGGALLDAAGAPAGAVEMLVKLLGRLFPSGVGLPMGFEGSGPIANLFFGAVDAELAAWGIPSLRWTDDLDTFLRDVTAWPAVHEMVEGHLMAVGIPLNPDKTGVEEKGDRAAERLFDLSRDSVFNANDPAAAAEDRFNVELWLEDNFGFTGDPPAGALRSRLRALMRRSNPAALEFLKRHPHWLDWEPRAVGDYLRALAADSHARKAIDLDWLMERAIERKPSLATAAGQLHACRALAAYRLDHKRGRAMHQFAYDRAAAGEYLALGAWSVRAYAESQGWKRRQACHLIDDVDHHGYRRATMMGFAGMPTADRHKPVTSMRAKHPEVGPVAELLLAGAAPGSSLP